MRKGIEGLVCSFLGRLVCFKKGVLMLLAISLLASCVQNRNQSNSTSEDNSSEINKQYSFKRGVSRTELPRLEGGMETQKAMLDSIKVAGAETIRLSLSRSNLRDEVRDHILYANKIGLKVLVMIKLGGLGVLYPPDVEERSGQERFWNVYPHSKIDSNFFDEWIKDLLQYWKEAGCQIDVLEVGNEFAWTDFNGDFPVMPRGEGFLFDYSFDWNSIPEDVKESVRMVGLLAKKVKSNSDEIFTKNPPKVTLGGLNKHVNTEWMVHAGGTLMLPELALQIIKGTAPGQPETYENYLKSIDGIGVHFYPNDAMSFKQDFEAMTDDAGRYINDFMSPIRSVTDLPVYVTEMGFDLARYGAENDLKRTQLIFSLFEAMEQTKSNYNWKQVDVYSWDQGTKRLTNKNGEPLHSVNHIFK